MTRVLPTFRNATKRRCNTVVFFHFKTVQNATLENAAIIILAIARVPQTHPARPVISSLFSYVARVSG